MLNPTKCDFIYPCFQGTFTWRRVKWLLWCFLSTGKMALFLLQSSYSSQHVPMVCIQMHTSRVWMILGHTQNVYLCVRQGGDKNSLMLYLGSRSSYEPKVWTLWLMFHSLSTGDASYIHLHSPLLLSLSCGDHWVHIQSNLFHVSLLRSHGLGGNSPLQRCSVMNVWKATLH